MGHKGQERDLPLYHAKFPIILVFKISKTQQLSNWEADHLSEAQIRYAATDAWVCREMFLKLMVSEKNPLHIEETPEKN